MGEVERDDNEVEAPGIGPYAVKSSFMFERPQNQYRIRKGRPPELRDDAPDVPVGRAYGDLDKLLRALFDALTGTFWIDDDSIFRVTAERRFAEEAGAIVRVHDAGLERLYGASSLFAAGPTTYQKGIAGLELLEGYARALNDQQFATAAADIRAMVEELLEGAA
jgi:hypothetical protein